MLILAAIFSLSACAPMSPDVLSPQLKTPQQFDVERTFYGKTRQWPQQQWWLVYNDKQLNTLINDALASAPSMTIAQARLRYASAMSQLAGSALKPQIDGQASASSQKISYNYSTPPDMTPHGTHGYGTMMLNFNWEIDFWGKNRAALEAAISSEHAAQADLAQARLTLSTAIASEYGELARLYAQKDTTQTITNVRKHHYELFAKRQKYGLETQAAVEQAKALYAQMKEQQTAVDTQIILQKHRIAALLGEGPDKGLAITRPQLNLKNNTGLPEQLQLQLLGRRPDIVAAKWRVQAGMSTIEKQKAEFYPNVNLSSFIGYQSLGLSQLLKSGSDTYGIVPAISLPIFTAGRLDAQLQAARAEHDQAIGIYNQTLAQAFEEVADAITSKRQLNTQLEHNEIALEAARRAYTLTLNRYKGGLSNYLEVLQAQQSMLSILQTNHDLKSQIFIFDISLIKALGGGYEQSISQNKTSSTVAQSSN